MSEYKLLLPEEESERRFRIGFRKLGFVTCALPAGAFFFCVVYSLVYNFESTNTHCRGGRNVLPSISAAIGGYSPQKEVWKVTILLHSPVRFLLIYLQAVYNCRVLINKAGPLILVLALLQFVEIMALIILSLFDSTYHYSTHETSFIIFVLSSEIYMLLTLVVQRCYRKQARNKSEVYSLKAKAFLALINIMSILLAMYYFVVHNHYCTDFAYTKFAICEYLVVFSNIAYHFTSVYDYHGHDLALDWDGFYFSPS